MSFSAQFLLDFFGINDVRYARVVVQRITVCIPIHLIDGFVVNEVVVHRNRMVVCRG